MRKIKKMIALVIKQQKMNKYPAYPYRLEDNEPFDSEYLFNVGLKALDYQDYRCAKTILELAIAKGHKKAKRLLSSMTKTLSGDKK